MTATHCNSVDRRAIDASTPATIHHLPERGAVTGLLRNDHKSRAEQYWPAGPNGRSIQRRGTMLTGTDTGTKLVAV